MARSINRLSARSVASKNKRGRYADGGGLYLQVSDNEAKSWLFRFMLNGKSRQMGLGSLHTISLSEARDEALLCRKQLRDNVDPIEARKLKRGQVQLDAAAVMTFKACAEKYISSHSAAWKSVKHTSQWQRTLVTYVYPVFGDLPVQFVDTGMVTKVIEPIWVTKTETASRIRGRIESILDWATARKYRTGENPARWKGHLDNLLPMRSKVQKIKHHAALPYPEIGKFMVSLRQKDAVSASGLEFLILTAARTGEVMGATWDEIDFDNSMWAIPSERMKNGKGHRVPLSTAAIEVLRKMKKNAESKFVFPGSKNNKPLSNMAFLQLLKRMGRHDLTAHGFRSTFRDWVAERTNYPNEVAEMALAHTVGDKVEAAYRRGDMFDKRRNLSEDWCGFCAKVPDDNAGGNVVPIKGQQ
jgi:integrase